MTFVPATWTLFQPTAFGTTSTHLMNTKTELIEGLRDAYAMEKAMEIALQKLMAHPHTHLALHKQASLHCTATRRHAEALAACLRRLGSEASLLKAELAQGMELMKSVGAGFVRDERIKDVLTIFATEHFEIACHARLRTGAQHFGLLEIVRICDEILLAEKRMSKWLEFNLPQITEAYLMNDDDEATQSESVPPVNRIAQWEFSQLEQNKTLFGVTLPRAA
jgi:ferritin-like metal-binding protein YciE